MNNFLTNALKINLILVLIINTINSEPPIIGRCGRPAVPANAYTHGLSPEKVRFDNNEKVFIRCKSDEFPLIQNKVVCSNGRWIGKQSRCGRHLNAQVINLDIHDCQSPKHQLLVSQPLNLTDEPAPGYGPIPANSYHWLRVRNSSKTSANGSKCYTFRIRFDREVQIGFLLAEILANTTEQNITLDVSPFVSKYRECVLHEQKRRRSGGEIFRNYFICDLKNVNEYKKELMEAPDVITLTINTNFNDEVGLDGVFLGDIFTKTSGTKNVRPDCGQIEVKNLGYDIQDESGLKYVICNDSFVDKNGQNINLFAPNGNPMHKFTCNWNGLWEGEWPVCLPKKTCPQESIMQDFDRTVKIEEIGNVYYMNESKWYAINDTFIRYVCVNENDIMVGQKYRTCLKSGQWSNKPPSCTPVLFSGISGLGIAGILFAILLGFVLIVLVVFRMHSRNVKRELRETRNVVEETSRKRYSDELYSDVKNNDFYDNPLENSRNYESVDYETVDGPRYGADPNHNRTPSPDYLVMTVR